MERGRKGGKKTSECLVFTSIVLTDENEYSLSVSVPPPSLFLTLLLLLTSIPLYHLVVNHCKQLLLLTRRLIALHFLETGNSFSRRVTGHPVSFSSSLIPMKTLHCFLYLKTTDFSHLLVTHTPQTLMLFLLVGKQLRTSHAHTSSARSTRNRNDFCS